VSSGAPPELHRPVAAPRLGEVPLAVTVVASEAECAAIAARLRIVAVQSLECAFTLRRRDDQPDDKARGLILAEGELRATVAQECVVTLDPFEERIEKSFRIRFARAGTEIEDFDPSSEDELPYEAETIDLGEATVEELALALDPYPRKPGAALPEGIGLGPSSPFAALARRDRGS
jgi:hypothetical protein